MILTSQDDADILDLTQNPHIAAGYRLKVFFTSLPLDHLWTRLKLVLNILYLATTTGMMTHEDDQGKIEIARKCAFTVAKDFGRLLSVIDNSE